MESEREVGTKRIERDWSWHLAQAGRQNKTLAQYAREHRVSVSSLYNARHASKRLGQELSGRPAPFVPVKLVAPLAANDRMSVQARLRNGVTVDLPVVDESADSLWALLNVLSRLPCSD